MAVLYSRIVYALWLKRVEDNQPAFQQRVSSSNKTETLNVKEYFASNCLRVSLSLGVLVGILKRNSKGCQDRGFFLVGMARKIYSFHD